MSIYDWVIVLAWLSGALGFAMQRYKDGEGVWVSSLQGFFWVTFCFVELGIWVAKGLGEHAGHMGRKKEGTL